MRKALLALAGLFFLLLAYSSFPSTAGSASSPASGWKEIRVSNVDPGRSYRVDGCLTVVSGGVDYVALRLAWHDGLNGYGVQLSDEDATGAASLIGAEQCLSLTDTAPCRSRSALYGVVVSGDGDAVEVDSASLDLTALATTKPCPTPTATPVATATPTSGDKPKEPTAKPEGQATTTTPTPEPLVYPALVNGSFEQARADGTPQAWRKFGGEMRRTSAAVHEGKYAASLRSTTESTKWLYQAVTVKGGHAYRLSAFALKDDPDLAEVYLRISWYESDDATGTATKT
ncbi:MAG: hypothetical protein HYS09_03715, partial [Chloroflexi bacterium]|nr:hypothetical protein [Chloroflexota bacterium]